MFGLCMLSVIPLRVDPSDKSEIVSQILFGEHFEIIDTHAQWFKIRLDFDSYEGWIDSKQCVVIDKDAYVKLADENPIICSDLVNYVSNNKEEFFAIMLGSSLNFIHHFEINTLNFVFDGIEISGVKPKTDIVKTSFQYLNAPYLWGGKTPFGIDCSGFTQMVYKLCGYKLLRDASQQATQGDPLSFIEESEPGDLAFFDNADGNITHVGIIMADNYIIHASGKVRIDRLDHLGIYNVETKKHTHKLRVIKKIV